MNLDPKNDVYDDEIDLKKIFLYIWEKKIFLLSITSLFAISSVIYSLSLTNTYTSSAILTPSSNENSLSSQVGQSGLAALAGISISSDGSTKSQEAIERIKSYDFFSEYFLPNIKLENLMAVKGWNPEGNVINYHESEFDSNKNKWIRDVSYPKKTIPSAQEAYQEKYKEILKIYVNKDTGFITLSIDHKSPLIAKKWLDIIILNINESMKARDRLDAQNSIKFLSGSSNSTNIQSIRDVISALLESQMQTLMLAYSNDAYIFKIIESPIAPEKKSGPARAVICILGTIFGGFISIVIILFNYYRRSI